jgi:hypothetical protein
MGRHRPTHQHAGRSITSHHQCTHEADGELPDEAKLRSSKYLNNLIEQKHCGVKPHRPGAWLQALLDRGDCHHWDRSAPPDRQGTVQSRPVAPSKIDRHPLSGCSPVCLMKQATLDTRVSKLPFFTLFAPKVDQRTLLRRFSQWMEPDTLLHRPPSSSGSAHDDRDEGGIHSGAPLPLHKRVRPSAVYSVVPDCRAGQPRRLTHFEKACNTPLMRHVAWPCQPNGENGGPDGHRISRNRRTH